MDLPHLKKIGDGAWMKLKYGKLPVEWEKFIKNAFDEAFRVTKKNGTLIFKWNENQIPVNKIIDLIGVKPIFGHPTRHSKTIWLTFFKF